MWMIAAATRRPWHARKRLSAVLALAVCVIAADTALWLAGSWALHAEAARWQRQAEAHGWTVSSARQSWGGWPFAASLTLDRFAISGGGRYLPGGLAWSADRVVASVSAAHPLTLCIEADGQQFLRLAHAPDIGFVAGSAAAQLPFAWTRHGRGTLALADVTGGIAGSRYPQDVQVAALSLLMEIDPDRLQGEAAGPPSTIRFDLHVRHVGLPDIGRWPLGATVAEAGATVSLTAPRQGPQPGRTGADMDHGAAQAAAWRDAGGTVVVRDAVLRWGPLGLRASAKLGLDSGLQPAGSGTAYIRGTTPALDAATQAGLIAPGMALTAKAALAVMAHADGPDGDAMLPFRLHDSTVSVAEIPVARVPDIRW